MSCRFAAVAAALVVIGGCGDDGGTGYTPDPFTPTAATAAYCGDDYEQIEERITGLLGQLTVAQKVRLMHGERGLVVEPNLAYAVEGVPELDIPGLQMLDGPRGISKAAEVFATAFPVAMLRGATWDPQLERRVGEAMARELRATGGNVLLAPTINILRHPRWGRAQETYSEDTHHMGAMGVAFIQGVQSEKVIASVKHLAANSIEDTRHDVDVTMDERTLREIYLPHFRRAVQDAQVGSVMSAYNSLNGSYADVNSHLLTDILKDEWQFQGFVESDWFFGTHSNVESVRAGLDIEMPAGLFYSDLVGLVADGSIAQQELDVSVRRILRAQFCYNLDTDPAVRTDSGRETTEHLALSREVAERGIVLLKNESALPIDDSSVSNVVVLGRLADLEQIGDNGSSDVTPTDVVTALEGITGRAGSSITVTHITNDVLTAGEETTVATADVVIVVVGYAEDDEGEDLIGAGDRETMELTAEEQGLILAVSALNSRTVVVLEGGASITMSGWLDQVAAVLMAWYPGQMGGDAIANILFGDVNPSGRLPISFPVADADLPPFDNVSTSVTYGYFHGYRHLANEATESLFPFGFGLSYTTFDLANPRTDQSSMSADGSVTVSVDVTNSGSVAGVQTIQVYVTAEGSRVMRSPLDLRGFEQVSLAPAETKTVSIVVSAADLAFYDVAASAWEVEALTYSIRLGTNARDTLPPLSISVSQ